MCSNGTSDTARIARVASLLAAVLWAPVGHSQELLSDPTLAGRTREWLEPRDDLPGIRAGAFDLRAAAGLGLGFDSNVLAAPSDRLGESVATAHALLLATNRSSRRRFSALGFAETRRFEDSHAQDASEYGVGADYGSADPRDLLELSFAAEQRFERHGDIETPRDIAVSLYDDLHARLRHTHSFNRLALSAAADSRRVEYRSASQTYRDRWRHRGELAATYQLRGDLAWTSTGWFSRDEFDDPATYTTSARTLGGLLGLRLEQDEVLAFELGAGWFQRRFDTVNAPMSGIALRGSLNWQPTRLMRLRAQLAREDEPTAIPGSFGKVRSSLDLSVMHDFDRRLTLSAAARAVDDEFDGTARDQRLYLGEIGAAWLIGRSSLLRLNLGYVSRETVDELDGFSRRFAGLSFTGRL